MAKKKQLQICFDRLPKDEEELIAWASIAIEVNVQNAPQSPLASTLICLADGTSGGFGGSNPQRMALYTTKKWQVGQEITFGFLRASATIADHARNAVAEIAKYANLKFREVSAASAMVRIADYEQGAYSYLGTDAMGIPRSQQTMNLARSWADLATAIHEWCHAVGMIHEHQSPASPADLWNEDAVYRYYSGPPNNWSRETIRQNVIERYSASIITQYTAWDRKSIMLYPIATELVRNPSYATGWNKELSETDKAFLATTYPGITQPPPPPTGNTYRRTDGPDGTITFTPV